tara:strand:+ start:530 stop:748 length:219 start_codon:yes stop_codon:yes gene_type:complete
MDMPFQSGSFFRMRGGFSPIVSLRALGSLLLKWQERIEERQRLENLDPRLLRDIGLSPADVAEECRKPFWRP